MWKVFQKQHPANDAQYRYCYTCSLMLGDGVVFTAPREATRIAVGYCRGKLSVRL